MNENRTFDWAGLGAGTLVLVVIVALGAAMAVIFWGIWFSLAGYIPKVMGVSRIWLDSMSAGIYGATVLAFAIRSYDEYDEATHELTCKIGFKGVLVGCPEMCMFSAFLPISIGLGIFFSLAASAACLLFMIILMLLGQGLYLLFEWWFARLSREFREKLDDIASGLSGLPIEKK